MEVNSTVTGLAGSPRIMPLFEFGSLQFASFSTNEFNSPRLIFLPIGSCLRMLVGIISEAFTATAPPQDPQEAVRR